MEFADTAGRYDIIGVDTALAARKHLHASRLYVQAVSDPSDDGP